MRMDEVTGSRAVYYSNVDKVCQNIGGVAVPTCPKCGGSHFGIKEFNVQNANYRHFAILCTSCGCVAGTETMQDDDRINRTIQELGRVSSEISALSNKVDRIIQALRLKGYII